MKAILVLLCLICICVLLLAYGERMLRGLRSLMLVIEAQPYERHIEGAPTILVVGDSTAYGTGASDQEESIAGRIGSDFKDYTILNRGKNGQKIQGLLDSVTKEGIPEDTKLMVIQIGANDILQFTDLDLVRTDLDTLLALAKERVPHVIVMTSGNVGGASAFAPYGSERSLRYHDQTLKIREIFMSLSAQHGVVYIDLYQEPEEDVFIQEPQVYMADDGLHPSGEGYGVWYKTLYPALQAHLGQ